MRGLIATILTLAAGLLVVNMLGVAVAEAPTTPPTRTVSVQGVARVPIAQGEKAAGANAIYRQAMAAAEADGQNKAEFLATKLSGSIGSVQSIAEGSGSISCSEVGNENSYDSYEGEEPDFPSTDQARVVAPLAAARPALKRKTTKKKKRTIAKKANTVSCTLSTGVSLVYLLN
jgi:hypothetical protein